MITYEDIRKNPEIHDYIEAGNRVLGVLGYTDHGFAHATKVAETAAVILRDLGFSEREQELAKIAGYLHDIGNMVNRHDHAQTGAILAFRLLDHIGLPASELAIVVGAIGNHDEGTGMPVSAVSAALILADKSDVRRTRVRNRQKTTFDIHDRVNYAVEESDLSIGDARDVIRLRLKIDTDISPVMDYFEIFLSRMLMCRRAAEYLGLPFQLIINGNTLL